jgi:hypothetical protein
MANEGYDPNAPQQGGQWWQGPPPAGYTGPWPPPLPPGGSYGPNLGQIIYGPNTGIAPPVAQPGDWGNAPAPAPTPGIVTTPTSPTGPAGPAAASDYDFATARGKIEAAIGRPMTPADIAYAFQTWGGNEGSRFTDAGIAPAIAHFKSAPSTPGGSNPGGPGGTDPAGFGATPAPYGSNPNAPSYNPMAPYVRPEWKGGDYVNPSEADLVASPGYQARLSQGLQARNRSAAAQGTVLSGGTLKALDRYGQDYASNEYQTLRNNTYDAYKTRYSQFQDAAGMDLAARTVNANDANTSYAARTAAYGADNTRTLSDYLQNVTTKRNSDLDYWNRLMDLTRNATGTIR